MRGSLQIRKFEVRFTKVGITHSTLSKKILMRRFPTIESFGALLPRKPPRGCQITAKAAVGGGASVTPSPTLD